MISFRVSGPRSSWVDISFMFTAFNFSWADASRSVISRSWKFSTSPCFQGWTPVLSKMFLLQGMRRIQQPSKALAPRRVFNLRSWKNILLLPGISQYFQRWFSWVLLMPKKGLAVLILTPTWLTGIYHEIQAFCRFSDWHRCQYWPTPMDLASIFTNSASGSCRRRAMEMAERFSTVGSGNSWRANSQLSGQRLHFHWQ